VVEVADVSRELCGGTHVANTAEVGIFKVVSEGSSAANVRRVECLTGPAAIDWFRERGETLDEVGRLLGAPRDPLAGARRASERLAELEQLVSRDAERRDAGRAEALLDEQGEEIDGIHVVVTSGPVPDHHTLLDLADRLKARLGEAAVVIGAQDDGRIAVVASLTPGAIEHGLSAVDVVREAAGAAGGGGGGRADAAQAGGKGNAEDLARVLVAAREALERGLAG
jgi:alanyl-tRNA synthetase